MRFGEILFKPFTIGAVLVIYLLIMLATQPLTLPPTPVKDTSSTVLGIGNTNPSGSEVFIKTISPTPFRDTSKPALVISSPWEGSVIYKNSPLTISATASDNISVNRVEFYINDVLYCLDSLSPYTCIWNAPAKSNQLYTITANAVDGANNWSSATVTVTSR